MAATTPSKQEQFVDKLIHQKTGFEPNAIIRGAQLTFVGAHRALQNPSLFTSDHYRQAALAVTAGIAIQLLIWLPIAAVRVVLWFLGFVLDLQSAHWDDFIVETLDFVQRSVLQVPFFLMTMMRYVTPTLDNVFMESLDWVDQTYLSKHKSDDPKGLRAMYYPNLRMYTHGSSSTMKEPGATKKNPVEAMIAILYKFGRRAGLSLAVYFATFIPMIGRFVLPAVSFYTFNNAVGIQPAIAVFATALVLPKVYLVHFLQTYFSSRTLMRELLVPYFTRIQYTNEQKQRWFKDREGVLFGFAMTFAVILKVPLVGVLIYGIAEASTAYLITKITDPPPAPAESSGFAASQVHWKNKHEFMNLPLAAIDAINVKDHGRNGNKSVVGDYPSQKFS